MQVFREEGKCAFWRDMITLKGSCFIGDKLKCIRVMTSFVRDHQYESWKSVHQIFV